MKYFLFLFTFYLFTLSVLPCSDTEECNTISKKEISQNNNHDKHTHDNEQCTPFCTCACCGIHAFQFQAPLFYPEKKTILLDKKQLVSFYQFIYNKRISSKIWQPPKIS